MAEAIESPNTPVDENPANLEVLNRVRNIPVIHSALEKTGATYSYVKDSHHLINWALNYAEAGLHYAASTAAPVAAPLAKKFEGSIHTVDQKLCEGLDIVERNVPIVKEPPQQIYDAAKAVVSSTLQPTIEKLISLKESGTQQVSTLKDISLAKVNELLNTNYGTKAIQGVDNTSVAVNHLLDHYFPVVGDEDETPAPVSADENKVLHAVQTIGQLSTHTAGRVYHSVAAQLRTVKKEDVSDYISSVISILHLTNFLSIDEKEASKEKPASPETEEQDKEK